ncbi:MAG: aminotransferase class III-fold pyridoxal phosphate-dependent enzyme, partial [Rhodospirillaceae bacterium]|nr:aminotransferase class III-fold pyridoxal phosphate-dependent enzyme [Rhodospirillaceae bacterium]
NPVSCAAANTVIDIVERDNLAANARRQGERLRDGLLRIQGRFPARIGDVRGRGLMQALELVADETAGDRTPAPELTQALLDAARARGLMMGRGGTYNNVIRISPPLNVSGAEVDEALGILDRSMAAVS